MENRYNHIFNNGIKFGGFARRNFHLLESHLLYRRF